MKLTARTARTSTRDDGTLRVAVVADTHSAPHREGVGHLAALRPDAIVHAGDIGNLEVLDRLGAIAPLFAVRGNIDEQAPDLPDALILDVMSPRALALRILVVHIGVNGPRLRADVARRAKAEDASMVVCGHSHVPFIGRDKGFAVFNPGSIGPRRFHLPIVFGTIEVTPSEVRLAHVDCETGEAWRP
jgi:putative phosphoesterase